MSAVCGREGIRRIGMRPCIEGEITWDAGTFVQLIEWRSMERMQRRFIMSPCRPVSVDLALALKYLITIIILPDKVCCTCFVSSLLLKC